MKHVAQRVNKRNCATIRQGKAKGEFYDWIGRQRLVDALQKFVESFSCHGRREHRRLDPFGRMSNGFLPFYFFVQWEQIDFVPNVERGAAGDAQIAENFVHGFIQFLMMRT